MLRISAMTVLALSFLAGHALMLYDTPSNAAVPVAALASGVIILAVLKHLGLLGSLWTLIWRRLF